MDDRFNDDDIGKLVSLELNPKTHPIAKALGADKVEVYGRILELEQEYIKLEIIPFCDILIRGKKNTKEILYSDIINYSF